MFEEIIKTVNPILTAKWLRRELNRVLNYNKKELHQTQLKPHHMQELLELTTKIIGSKGDRPKEILKGGIFASPRGNVPNRILWKKEGDFLLQQLFS